ncbi:MAG: hypothetical protein Q9162_004335 [Coniocarpon cinnabarinum]
MSSDTDSKRPLNTSQETTTSAAVKNERDDKPSTTVQPLAPPPKPSQQDPQQPSQTPDYFGASHNSSHFSLEPNPFEQSFGNPSSGETSGKGGGLPPVASLTSPAPLGPGGTPNWQNSLRSDSLRSGPLSPAMLQGPINNSTGYFDQEFRNNYPTPNESSLRTGLTPGGGGSMFPAPSPNTQALFNNLNGGQPTPGTAEFQRAAAAAARKSSEQSMPGANGVSKAEYQPAQQTSREPFGNTPQESEAVNSLYMLAQPGARQGANANQFALQNQQPNMNAALQQQQMNAQQQQQSPTQHRNNGSMDMSGGNEDDDDGKDEKPSGRSKGKKGSASKAGQPANGRRKTDETPAKVPPKKRSRGNNGMPTSPDMEDFDDDDMDIKDEAGQTGPNGRKMTDEEKRKNFLERNRVAALKCRQRKKQWLANLQTKVEIFTQENDALSTQCSQLREEIINLKTLLLAHKDCPVSHSQGLGGAAMAQYMGSLESSNGAFAMAGGMQMPQMAQSVQRRLYCSNIRDHLPTDASGKPITSRAQLEQMGFPLSEFYTGQSVEVSFGPLRYDIKRDCSPILTPRGLEASYDQSRGNSWDNVAQRSPNCTHDSDQSESMDGIQFQQPPQSPANEYS